MVALVCVVAVLGLAVGSFVTVVAYRVPRGESLLRPGSHCPSCGRPVRARHNVPVLGWLVLRGRCADCAAPIGIRYPLVELGTGVLFAALTLRLGALHLLSALPAYLYFAALGVALSAIDLATRRLPNVLVLPGYAVLAVLLAGSAAVQHDWSSLGRAAIGAALLFAFYFLLAFIYPAGMGFGDVKLAGLIGAVLAYLSWGLLLIGALAGFVLGALAGVVVLVSRRGGRKTALPFGPFMIAGALLAVFAGSWLVHAYLSALSQR